MTANAPAITYRSSRAGSSLRWLRGIRSVGSMFTLIVVIPTALAVIYFGVLASNIYVSEARFVVRGVNGQNIGGLAALFRTLGIARSVDDTFAVQNFMKSRDAMAELDKRLNLRRIYTHPDIDFVARFEGFWPQPEFESLYNYYQTRVEVIHNDVTGVTTLKVSAFTAGDSFKIASNLLQYSETFVNRINSRATKDAMDAAQKVLREAEEKRIAAQRDLTAFRIRENFIDPLKTSIKGNDLIATITADLAEASVRRNELMEISPANPAIPGLNSRIGALEEQIALEKAKIAGGDQSIAMKLSKYERLNLQKEFTDRALTSALEALESARQEVRQKKLYIETIVRPNLPDKATEPKRLHNIIATICFSFLLYFMAWLIFSGAQEHSHAG